MTIRELAEKFGVSERTIGNVTHKFKRAKSTTAKVNRYESKFIRKKTRDLILNEGNSKFGELQKRMFKLISKDEIK